MVNKKSGPAKIISWRRELEEIKEDVSELLLKRYFYQELRTIVESNSKINRGNPFWDSLRNNYVASAVLGVRRQMDTDQDSRSLVNLLNNIFDNPEILTRSWYASGYSDKILNLGEKDFEDNFGKGVYIDPSLVYADIGELKHNTKKIVLFGNKAIAHTDIKFRKNRGIVNRKTRTTFKVDFDNLDSAIDTLEQKVIKYNLLLNQSSYAGLLPIIQYDWQEIFRVPWI